MLEAARKLAQLGFSPIPVYPASHPERPKQPYSESLPLEYDPKEDTEKPSWKPFQSRIADDSELQQFFANGASIAVTCGKASGNLYVFDFDEPGYFEEWMGTLDPSVASKMIAFKTPSGGHHVWVRLPFDVPGNTVYARTERGKVAIESRGMGGYVLAAPTEGYKALSKSAFAHVPSLTEEEFEDLQGAAYDLHNGARELYDPSRGNPSISRPGDAFAKRNSWMSLLEADGWVHVGRHGLNDYWRRPGKTKGKSASTNGEDGHFYVFTANAFPLEPMRAYTKFAYFAKVKHNGDFHFAAQQLKIAGYGGSKSPQKKERVKDVDGNDVERTPRKWFTFDTIEAADVNWLVEPYLPLGIGYTLLYGDSDHGKSTALLSMIAELSNGRVPGTGKQIKPVRSIILSAEDSATHVVKPRLIKLGANMKNIMAPEEFNEDGTPNPLILDEEGAEELLAQVKAFGAKLIAIDPLSAYFDGDNMNDRIQARTWTRRITNMGIQTGSCPVIVHHVNKGTAVQGRYRASGSQDFFDAARSALMAVKSIANPDDYALVHEKHNLTVQGDAMGYTFSRERGFEWTGASDLTSESVTIELQEHVEPGKLKTCKDWILEQLENGPMLSDDLLKGAKQEGYSPRTFKRAKSEMGDRVRSWKEKAEDGRWFTQLRDFGSVYRGGE